MGGGELTPTINPSNLVIFWRILVHGNANPCMEAVFFAVFADVETGVVVFFATATTSFFAEIDLSSLLTSYDLSIKSCATVTFCPVIACLLAGVIVFFAAFFLVMEWAGVFLVDVAFFGRFGFGAASTAASSFAKTHTTGGVILLEWFGG